jgi:hypothetical protein
VSKYVVTVTETYFNVDADSEDEAIAHVDSLRTGAVQGGATVDIYAEEA